MRLGLGSERGKGERCGFGVALGYGGEGGIEVVDRGKVFGEERSEAGIDNGRRSSRSGKGR
jgi:hypothetical protein